MSAEQRRRAELGEQAARDAIRVAVDVRSHDPLVVWQWLRSLPADRLQAMVVCLACWVDVNQTTDQLEQRIRDVVRGVA